MLLHHWHFGMGGGDIIPQSAWVQLEKNDNRVEAI
jgi:hypothetical protein